MEDRMNTFHITGSPSKDLTKLGWSKLKAGQKQAALACFLAVLMMRRARKSHVVSARRGVFAATGN
jgi:hypothetical protein